MWQIVSKYLHSAFASAGNWGTHCIIKSWKRTVSFFLPNERTLLTLPPSSQMPEEEAFCVFVRLMQEYRLRELFKPSMAELGLCIYQFEYLLQVKEGHQSLLTWGLQFNTHPQRGSKSERWQRHAAYHSLITICPLKIFSSWNLPFCGVLGATSRAERPLSIPEFPHIHVCLILVPHPFPHLPPSACRHAHLWYFHVWGRTLSKHVFVSVRCFWDLLIKIRDLVCRA